MNIDIINIMRTAPSDINPKFLFAPEKEPRRKPSPAAYNLALRIDDMLEVGSSIDKKSITEITGASVQMATKAMDIMEKRFAIKVTRVPGRFSPKNLYTKIGSMNNEKPPSKPAIRDKNINLVYDFIKRGDGGGRARKSMIDTLPLSRNCIGRCLSHLVDQSRIKRENRIGSESTIYRVIS